MSSRWLVLVGACAVALGSAPRALAEDVVEPRTGVKFADKLDGMTLLGVGLRTKTFLKVKVYAAGLYVADAALRGPLLGTAATGELHKAIVWGDFPKQVTLKLVRDLSASQMQEAIREALAGANADKARTETFVSYFTDIKTGEEYAVRWAPGGVLETLSKGQPKPPIADKAFAAAVFSIWLGDKPIQEDLKRDLVSRAPQVMK